jgi:putative ABC transport system permease protein
MENNNIKSKLARGFLNKNRLFKNILLTTIAISSTLLLLLLLLQSGEVESHKKTQEGKAQVKLISVTEEQLYEMENMDNLTWYAIEDTVGITKNEDFNLIVKYVDEDFIKNQVNYTVEGSLPTKDDELLVSRHYLDEYEIDKGLNDEIAIDLLGNGEPLKYKITGIVDDEEKTKSYNFYISKSLWERLSSDQVHTTFLRLDTNAIGSTEILADANQAIKNTTFDEGQIFLTEYFSVMSGLDRRSEIGDMTIYFLIIIMLTTLMIYSTFYNSIMEDIKYLGQLRTIGYSKKMIRKIVIDQAVIITIRGFLYTLAVPIIVAFIIYPNGFKFINVLKYSLLTFVIVGITALISIIPIIRKINRISPAQGLSYNVYSSKKKQRTNKVTFRQLVKLNLFKNKKRAILTFLLMIVSSFIVITTLVINNSIDVEKRAKTLYFSDGEIQLSISNLTDSTFSEDGDEQAFYSTYLQRVDNPLKDENLIQSLEGIQGIQEIYNHDAVNASFTRIEEGGSLTTISNNFKIINSNDYEDLKPLLDNKIEYEEILDSNGIVVSNSLSELNDRFEMNYRNEDDNIGSLEVEVLATYPKTSVSKAFNMVPNNDILIPIEMVESIIKIDDPSGILSLKLDKSAEFNEIKQQVEEMIAIKGNIEMWSLDEAIRSVGYMFYQILKLLKTISIILVVFSFIAIVASYFSSLFSRRNEMELMRNIGLTIKEVTTLIVNEYRVLILGSFIPALIGSGLFAFFILRNMDRVYSIVTFKYPILQVITYFIAQLILLEIIKVITKRKLENFKHKE